MPKAGLAVRIIIPTTEVRFVCNQITLIRLIVNKAFRYQHRAATRKRNSTIAGHKSDPTVNR
jgi:hypothetical protein